MKLADALNALQLVPADSARAVAAAEFARKWRCAGLRDVSVRQVHRWLLDLERLNLVSSTTDGAGMCPLQGLPSATRLMPSTHPGPYWASASRLAS
jgi:hypothetical protein